MPKQTYVPTPADHATGRKLRALRRRAGETLDQTIDRSGVGFRDSTLSKVELGQRALTLPEATKLAAHFNTTAEWIMTQAESVPVPTEQEWLGNDKPALPGLAPVPDLVPGLPILADLANDHIVSELKYLKTRTLEINLDQPLSPAEYREQVWIPYLEHRYAADLRQTG